MNYKIAYTEKFNDWLNQLQDRRAKAKIKVRLDRIVEGNLGDYKSLGDSLSELRIHFGQGYRVYYTIRNKTLVILLAGSNKRDQSKTIKLAKKMLNELED